MQIEILENNKIIKFFGNVDVVEIVESSIIITITGEPKYRYDLDKYRYKLYHDMNNFLPHFKENNLFNSEARKLFGNKMYDELKMLNEIRKSNTIEEVKLKPDYITGLIESNHQLLSVISDLEKENKNLQIANNHLTKENSNSNLEMLQNKMDNLEKNNEILSSRNKKLVKQLLGLEIKLAWAKNIMEHPEILEKIQIKNFKKK